MLTLKLYRKRFIPKEIVYLKDDVILQNNSDYLVTQWNCLHPRKDIARGISLYCKKSGYKISKIYNKNNNLVYWYCDIVQFTPDPSSNSLIITDLLIDILIYPDCSLRILDLDELSEALKNNLIDNDTACKALTISNNLLQEIYTGHFVSYQQYINHLEGSL